MIRTIKVQNKLKGILIENHKAPVVTIQAWVRTGSADEVRGEEGLSHFIEHLLFKGTEKYKVGEIATLIEGAGGELNAYTSFDQTVFYMTLSSQYMDLGLDAMSEMMGRPLFDFDEIDKEREVVIEEIKRSNDSPARRSQQLLFSSLYQKHPYGRPVIGYDEVVKGAPVSRIKDLFKRRYCPENMFLVIVGDFSQKDIEEKVKKYFKHLGGRLKKVKRPKEIKQKEPHIRLEKSNFQEAYLNIAWRTEGASQEDLNRLDLLSYLFSYGDNSRLVQSLRLKKSLVNSVGASQFTPKDSGFFAIMSHLDFQHIEETLDTIATEILDVLRYEPASEELLRAIYRLESLEDHQETMDAIARRVGNDELFYEDINYSKKYLRDLKRIKPRDISEVAKKYIRPDNLTLTVLYPETESEPKEVYQWVKAFQEAHQDNGIFSSKSVEGTKSVKSKIKKKTKPKLPYLTGKEILLKTGDRLILNPISGAKVVNAQAGFLGGVRSDPEGKIGVSEMLSQVWLSGTRSLKESEISSILESEASYIDPFSGKNSLGLQTQILGRSQQKTAKLFLDILTDSIFPEKEFKREKEVLLRYVKNLSDQPSALAFSDFLKLIYSEHPYSFETYGTVETLEKIEKTDLEYFYKKHVSSKNAMYVVSGAIEGRLWEDIFLEAQRKLPLKERQSKLIPVQKLEENKKNFRFLQKEQSHIIYGFRGIDLYSKSKEALTIIQTMLSGQGGRLFINLRDKASLAYTVSPIRMDGMDAGCFGAYIGCSPEKGNRAIAMIEEEFRGLVEKKVSEDELERAKRNIVGKYDIALQKTSTVSSGILLDELYGIKHRSPKEYAQAVFSVSADEIQKTAEALFTKKHVVNCVGPICPWKN